MCEDTRAQRGLLMAKGEEDAAALLDERLAAELAGRELPMPMYQMLAENARALNLVR